MKIRRRMLEAGVPAVAMADIAFNLVLFFIILARTQDDSHLKWDPAKAPNLENVSEAKISVTVDIEQKVYLNGKQISTADLKDAVKGLLGEGPQEKREVFLKVDKNAQAATFVPVIEAVSEAGGQVVHVLAEDS